MANWKFKINITTLLVIALGVVVFFFWNNRKSGEYARLMNNLEVEKTAFVTYQSEVDGTIIAKDLAYQMLEGELEAALADDSLQAELIDHYKKLSAVVKVETKFETDTIRVPVPVYIDRDTTINLLDPCFKADLSVTNGLITIDGLTVDNRQDIVLGERKNGLRRAEYAVDLRNSNPCINVTGMTSYIVVHEKKWFENPLITIPAGVVAGIIIDRTLIK